MMKSFFFFLFSCTTIVLLPHQETCSATAACPPSSCGKITNISYPFRLKGDPETCGHPKYELACENNRTILSLSSLFSGEYRYNVEAINYDDATVRLIDPGVQEDSCSSLPRYSLTQAPRFTSNDDDLSAKPYELVFTPSGYVIYLNCSNPVRGNPRYVDTPSCLLKNSKGHFYAVAGDLRAWDLEDDCQAMLVARTSIFVSYSYEPNQVFSYEQIHRLLLYGFEVTWFTYLSEDYCSSPLGSRFRCGSPLPKWRTIVEEVIDGIVKGLLQLISPLLRVIGYYDARPGIYTSKQAFKIGRVIGKYILPLYIMMRFIIGFIFLFGNWIYMYYTRHTSLYENIEDFLQGNILVPIRYSYKEIKNMTGGFKDKLGEGGYGTVYKGKLRSGPFVAVKMLNKPKANGQEFISEVGTIGRIHHANVVKLIGYSVEASKRALVYEFMPNGSLDGYISSKEDGISLTYHQMYTISLGVARGITYLHQGCDVQILHFDIKPHNILLGENFIPKVSDFGLARLYPIDNNIVTLTAARGTIGYMAPELFYKNIGGVSHKADVYSFGMLLMEMANRRRNLNPYADNSSQLFFPYWIYDQLIEEREIEMAEVTNEEKNNVKKMFIIALWCIQMRPDDRPSMDKVIEMLEGDVENITMPPKPSPYPTEIGINFDESISGDTSSSFLDESINHPLLKNSS